MPAPVPQSNSKLRNLLVLAAALLAFMQLARLAFLWKFAPPGKALTAAGWNSLYIGLKFDLRLVALVIVPPWLLLHVGSAQPRRRGLAALILVAALLSYLALVAIGMVDDHGARPWLVAFLALAALHQAWCRDYGLASGREAPWIWIAYAMFVAAFIPLAYEADFGSYSYNHVRLNGTLLGFLQDPRISALMVWQSYPVIRGLMFCGLLLLALAWSLRRSGEWRPLNLRSGARWSANVAISVLLVLVIWGKESLYPLRWGEVFDGRDRFSAHLALNPVLFFLETRVAPDRGPDMKTVRATHQALADYFGIPRRDDASSAPSLLRTIAPRPLVSGSPNVVFIQMESLSIYKTSLLGNRLDPTPFLRQLAGQSIFFNRFYVVMENTSRSMFATLFGIPDVSNLQINATRNPLLVDQHCLLNSLAGYQKNYFLGGSANWAQIRAAFKNNIPGLRIFEEGSYHAPIVDVWGVADVDMLLEGSAVLAASPQPYFAYFQTSGDHPPFTIPPHLHDFHRVRLPSADLTAAGFADNDDFNAVRLMDYSLGKFFAAQARSPRYQNTVYVLWADHGIARGNADPRYAAIPLAVHQIPLLIYAPGFIRQGRVVSTVGSQLDILPTVMSLLGHSTRTQTLGKDLLDPANAARSGAFTFSTFVRPPVIGFIRDQDYLILNPDGEAALYDLRETTERDHAAEQPAKAQQLRQLAEGFLAWSRYLMEHNKPLRGS
jgi:phosphoglycerol transferase MdoB-like AlkP superfamily enzyme